MLWLRSTHANFRIKLLFLFIFWKVGPSTKMRSTIFLVWNPQFLQVNYPYIPYKTGLLCRHQTDTTWGPPEPHPLPCRLVTGGGLRIFAKSKSFGWKTSGSSDVGQQQCLWKKSLILPGKQHPISFDSIKRSIKLWFKIPFEHSVPMIWFLGSELPILVSISVSSIPRLAVSKSMYWKWTVDTHSNV